MAVVAPIGASAACASGMLGAKGGCIQTLCRVSASNMGHAVQSRLVDAQAPQLVALNHGHHHTIAVDTAKRNAPTEVSASLSATWPNAVIVMAVAAHASAIAIVNPSSVVL